MLQWYKKNPEVRYISTYNQRDVTSVNGISTDNGRPASNWCGAEHTVSRVWEF